MRDCPKCGGPVDGLECPACVKPAESDWPAQMAAIRKRLADHPPSPSDLTDQQWYNVCKFFPTMAERCKRQRFQVSPDHPLDATAQRGPLLALVARKKSARPSAEVVPFLPKKIAMPPPLREPGEEG